MFPKCVIIHRMLHLRVGNVDPAAVAGVLLAYESIEMVQYALMVSESGPALLSMSDWPTYHHKIKQAEISSGS